MAESRTAERQSRCRSSKCRRLTLDKSRRSQATESREFGARRRRGSDGQSGAGRSKRNQVAVGRRAVADQGRSNGRCMFGRWAMAGAKHALVRALGSRALARSQIVWPTAKSTAACCFVQMMLRDPCQHLVYGCPAIHVFLQLLSQSASAGSLLPPDFLASYDDQFP